MSEELLRESVETLVLVVEAAAMLIIVAGVAVAFVRLLVAGVRDRGTDGFVAIRLGLGRFLALGLEFLLAADLLETAIAPSFEQIGKLAAVAAIRTALNYFLEREIRAEQAELRGEE